MNFKQYFSIMMLIIIFLLSFLLFKKIYSSKQNDEPKYPVYAVYDGFIEIIDGAYYINPDFETENLLKKWDGYYGLTQNTDLEKLKPQMKERYEECMADEYSVTKNEEYCVDRIYITIFGPSGDPLYSLIELAENIKDGARIKKEINKDIASWGASLFSIYAPVIALYYIVAL